jgi:UDP-N-acetylglucosamine 2-epimerase (non-hydrolysing)
MILLTYGTRPEYIKVKPLIDEMGRRGIPFKTLSTGQHKDIVPQGADFDLTMVDYDGNRLDSVMKNCLSIPDDCFKGITYVLVQGDTTSVVGLAMSALHRKIKVIHLEAGLRTHDTENPYPEENNRKIVSTLADIHLCPTQYNKENLLREGISEDKIFVVGNTVLDGLLEYKKRTEYLPKVLVTLHRRENHELIDEWFTTINELAKRYSDYQFILPIHPNPNVKKHEGLLTNITVVPPMNHDELLETLIKSTIVITDSGGIQEESSFFNKKCLVCRKVTERPESLGKTSFLVEEPKDLSELFRNHILNFDECKDCECPYGDGDSSKIICDIFESF